MEAGAEDASQEWNCLTRSCFQCFFSCFWIWERLVIVLLYCSICVAVVTSMLLGVVTVVSTVTVAACDASINAVLSMCPGMYLLQAVLANHSLTGLIIRVPGTF